MRRLAIALILSLLAAPALASDPGCMNMMSSICHHHADQVEAGCRTAHSCSTAPNSIWCEEGGNCAAEGGNEYNNCMWSSEAWCDYLAQQEPEDG